MSSHPAAQPEASTASLFAVSARSPVAAPARSTPPPRSFDGPPLDPRTCVEKGTFVAVLVSSLVALASSIALVLVTYGIILVLVVGSWIAAQRARVLLRASALRIGPRQLPEIHGCVATLARRLGLSEAPETYVVDRAEVNGFALRFGRRNGIVLTDEVVAGALEGRGTGGLGFVIAHELAHIGLGHHRPWRSLLRRNRWLSRLDELTADRVACELLGSQADAEEGVLLLVTGPTLLAFVDRASAQAQATEVAGDKKVKRAERMLTHPVALRRLHRVAQHFAAERREAA